MIISKILKIHNGKIFCNIIKSEFTASNPDIIIPITTGNIVNSNIPLLSTGFLSAQNNKNVQPNIREAAILDIYKYSSPIDISDNPNTD